MPTMHGDLEEYPVSDLVQFFHTTRKNGQLLFEQEDGGGSAAVYFERGEVVHAWCPPREGEQALWRLFTWRSGRFVFLKSAGVVERTIAISVPNLLLEGLRRIDERQELFDLLPAPETVLHMQRDTGRIGDVRLTAAEWRVMGLVNGRRTMQEVIELSGREEAEVAQILCGLLASGMVTEELDDDFLAAIIPERIPTDLAPRTRTQPTSLVASLLLKLTDGRTDLQVMKRKLGCADADLIEEVRMLVRTQWFRIVAGGDEYRRHIA